MQKVTVGGKYLNPGQVMTIQVALNNLVIDIQHEGLGEDDHGKEMARLYILRANEVLGEIIKNDVE